MKFVGRKGALPTFCETLKGVSTKIFQATFSFVNGPPQTQTLDPPLTVVTQLQQLQNRAARIVTGSSFDTSCQWLIKELGWKTKDQLITSETNIMVYKSLHELTPQYMSNLFTRASQLTSRCLRSTLIDLRLLKKSSKTSQTCFSFRGFKTWIGLSVE